MIVLPLGIFSLALSQAVGTSGVQTEADLTRFRDIKPHQEISVASVDAFDWVAVLLLVGFVLLSGAAAMLWYRYRRTPDPNSLAIAEIDRLESQFHEAPTEAYGQLSLLIRQWVSTWSDVNAMSQTTDQVVDSLHRSSVPERLVGQVGMLLRNTDESKFAGRSNGAVSPDEDIFDVARSIVQSGADRASGQAKRGG